MDVLIGGTNPVAVDAVSTRIMGIEPEDVPACLLAYLQGVGSMKMEPIELIGPSLDEVSSPFRRPELNLSDESEEANLAKMLEEILVMQQGK